MSDTAIITILIEAFDNLKKIHSYEIERYENNYTYQQSVISSLNDKLAESSAITQMANEKMARETELKNDVLALYKVLELKNAEIQKLTDLLNDRNTTTVSVSESSDSTQYIFDETLEESQECTLPNIIQYFDSLSLKKTTLSGYMFHLKALTGVTNDDFNEWINNAKTLTYKKQRMSLAQRIIAKFKLSCELPSIVISPINNNIKSNDEYNEMATTHIEKIDEIPLTIWTLFYAWLPTRRRDIFDLTISNTESDSDTGNHFYKDTATFVWREYKTLKDYGIQRLELNELRDIIASERLIKITDFLITHPTGKLFNICPDNASKRYKELNGINTQEARHMWVKICNIKFNQTHHRIISKWMAHSYECSQSVYRP